MRQRTTPLQCFEFPSDPEQYEKIRVNYVQNGQILLIKTEADMNFFSETVEGVVHYYGSYRLTQEETLKFAAGVRLVIEPDIKDGDGNVLDVEPNSFSVYPVTNKEVL